MQLLFLLFGHFQEMVYDVLHFLFQFIFWVLETIHKEGFVLAINLGNDMMPEMLDFMVPENAFKEWKAMEVKIFILLNTEIGHNLKVNIGDMVNDSASCDKMGITWLKILEKSVDKNLIGFGSFNFHNFAESEGLLHKVANELHELVDTMFIDKGPLLRKMGVKCLIEAEAIFADLFGEGMGH